MILPVHDGIRAHVTRLLSTLFALDESALPHDPRVPMQLVPLPAGIAVDPAGAFELRVRPGRAPAPTHATADAAARALGPVRGDSRAT